MKKLVTVLCMLVCLCSACTNVPGRVDSPRISFYTDKSDAAHPYRAVLSAGVFNENSDRALMSCTGTVSVYDRSHKKVLFTSAFSIPEILPFSTGVFTVEKRITRPELNAIIQMLSIPDSEISGVDALEGLDVPSACVKLDTIRCTIKKIDLLLKGKSE
jgi:hypothetical protein